MSKALCIVGLCLSTVVGEVTHSQHYILFKDMDAGEITLYALHAVDKGVESKDERIHACDILRWKRQYNSEYVQCMAPRITVQLEAGDNQRIGLPLEVLIATASTHCLSFMSAASPVLREDGTPYIYADGSRPYYLETKQELTIIVGFSD